MLNKYVDERRRLVLDWVYTQCDGTVKYGPFTGMKILPRYEWGDGDTGAKLLGLYETELFEYIEKLVGQKPDLVINYGCAEGYYGIGMAMKLPESQVYLFDINKNLLDIAEENAKVNNITNIAVSDNCTNEYLEELLSEYKNPVILMDCEGAEDFMLDLDKMPSLAKTTVLVEMHDFMKEGLTDRLVYKFNESHDLEGFTQGPRDLHIEPLTLLGDLDKLIIANENRPCTMSWIYMTPRDATDIN